MAIVTSNEYDHIDIINGSNTNRHMLKDTAARADIDDLKSAVVNSTVVYDVVKNKYINSSDGAIKPYTGWDMTDYIPVFDRMIVISPDRNTWTWWYDSNKSPLSQQVLIAGRNELTPPSGAAYFATSNDATKLAQIVIYNAQYSQNLQTNEDISALYNSINTTLIKHSINVTANTAKSDGVDFIAKKGDKLALSLDIGFYDSRNVAWYYTDASNVESFIGYGKTFMPYLFEVPADIVRIGIYIASSLIPASATYTMKVRKLSDVGVIKNELYLTPSDDIYSIIENIEDCDRYNPYYIHLASGEYDIAQSFTSELINSANYSDDGFVGLCLYDGMYLIGDGEKDTVILKTEIDTSYSSTIRNTISTINIKGECGFENITIIAKNIRYAVHDDYGYSMFSKHTYRNCVFIIENATSQFAYGNGMYAGLTAEFENCEFIPSALSHLSDSTSGWSNGSSFNLDNCKAEKVTIRNANTKIKCLAMFNNCNIGLIEYTNNGSTQYLNIEGTGTETLFSAENGTVYAVGDIYKTAKGTLSVGDCLNFDKTAASSNPYWIVIAIDSTYAYIQHEGYISSNVVGLTAGNVGDYWTISNGAIAVGGTADNAVAKIVAVVNGEAFAKLMSK